MNEKKGLIKILFSHILFEYKFFLKKNSFDLKNHRAIIEFITLKDEY